MNRIVRGNSWLDVHCYQSAYRSADEPVYRFNNLGFRVAKRKDRYRILRGGTYGVNLWGPRCAFRFRDKPRIRNDYLSLRVARRKP